MVSSFIWMIYWLLVRILMNICSVYMLFSNVYMWTFVVHFWVPCGLLLSTPVVNGQKFFVYRLRLQRKRLDAFVECLRTLDIRNNWYPTTGHNLQVPNMPSFADQKE